MKSIRSKKLWAMLCVLTIILVVFYRASDRRHMPLVNSFLSLKPTNTIPTHILPKQHMLVYTKYTNNDDLQRTCGCSLYVSELGKPDTEQKVYTFSLPKDVFFGDIKGIVDKHVVYTLSSGKLAIISLLTGENKDIQESSYKHYIDKINKKIYFTTEEGKNLGEDNKLYVYDVTTGTTKLLSNLSHLDKNGEAKKVIYATKDEVYLSYISRVGEDSNIWNKTFDLHTHKLKDAAFHKDNMQTMVISDDGKRLAYVVRDGYLPSFLHLHVYQTETKKDVEIFSISAGNSPIRLQTTFLSDIQFNRYGDAISFQVNSLYPNPHQAYYLSNLEVRKVPADAKGIILLPQDDPDIYKDVKVIQAIKNPLHSQNSVQWIQFGYYNDDYLLFEDKNITYLTNHYLDSIDEATPILINADHVQYIPSP